MDTTAMTVYTFPGTGQQSRIITIDGEPWWIAKDVCHILGLGDTSQAVSRLDDDEVRKYSVLTSQGTRQTSLVSESGLYSLILTSRKPEAKAFKRWVTHDVLPQIRKTGSYSVPKEGTFDHSIFLVEKMLENMREVRDLKERMAEAESSISDQDQRLQDVESLMPIAQDVLPLRAFISSRNIRLNRNINWSTLGKAVTAYSKLNGFPIVPVPHLSGAGTVNGYKIKALEGFFIEMGKLLPAPVVIDADEEDD